jgi:hypothetical protein
VSISPERNRRRELATRGAARRRFNVQCQPRLAQQLRRRACTDQLTARRWAGFADALNAAMKDVEARARRPGARPSLLDSLAAERQGCRQGRGDAARMRACSTIQKRNAEVK